MVKADRRGTAAAPTKEEAPEDGGLTRGFWVLMGGDLCDGGGKNPSRYWRITLQPGVNLSQISPGPSSHCKGTGIERSTAQRRVAWSTAKQSRIGLARNGSARIQ